MNLKKDSLKKIWEYNAEVTKKLIEFNKTASYLPSSEFDHLQHIRKYSTIEGIDNQIHNPKFFIDYVIENCLEDPQHQKHITDRKLLKKLRNVDCYNELDSQRVYRGYVSIVDTLENGSNVSITIKGGKFNKANRVLNTDKQNRFIVSIDGKYPYGAEFFINSTKDIIELSDLEIIIGGNKLATKIEEYNNLFNPNYCDDFVHQRRIEAYQDGDNIYVYLFGGENAGSYFAKLIFDTNSGYVGKIITDYMPLSRYGSFHDNFVGY